MKMIQKLLAARSVRWAGTWTALLLLSPLAIVAQVSYPTFGQVDYFWTQNPQLFQSLWKAAQTQTVRIAVLGDTPTGY
jgi:hypothetical protein